jgi:phosphatidate cytidylyltransferase
LLKWRIVSATVIIAGLVGLLFLDFTYPLGAPGVWLLPLVLAASALMVYELLDLWRDRPDCPAKWPVYAGALLTVSATAGPLVWTIADGQYPIDCPLGRLGWPLLGAVVGVVLAFVGEMARYTKPGRSTGSIALSVLAISYAGLLLSFLVSLRLFHSHPWGMVAVVSLVVVVKLSDTGAYFTGRALGRHKLAPVLSPGKTVEGSIGGMLAALLGGWVCYQWIAPPLIGSPAARGPLWAWLAYAVVVASAGMVGDLAESLLKRDVGRKDSSSWLPGLGGVLDILDSIVFAAAPAYVFWASGLIGPG